MCGGGVGWRIKKGWVDEQKCGRMDGQSGLALKGCCFPWKKNVVGWGEGRWMLTLQCSQAI